MTQQATITDELAFGQPYGEQEKQVLTPEAVEFLAETEEGDAYLFASKDKRIAFVTGHPEYDANTLASEFFRDVEAGLDPQVPHNYFPQNDPQNKPRATWRSHGNLLFINWLNYYVYQITPYDLRHMNPTLD